MSEWRGPWECETCGLIYGNSQGKERMGHCTGPHKNGDHVRLIPYERRKDDALAAMTRERDEAKESAIRSAEDAVALLGMKDKAERELAEAKSDHLEAMRGWKRAIDTGTEIERERDALREIVAQVGDWIPCSSKRNPRRRGCTCLSCRARAALKEGEGK